MFDHGTSHFLIRRQMNKIAVLYGLSFQIGFQFTRLSANSLSLVLKKRNWSEQLKISTNTGIARSIHMKRKNSEVDSKKTRNPVENAREVLQRLEKTQSKLKEQSTTLAGMILARDDANDDADDVKVAQFNGSITLLNSAVVGFQNTLKSLVTEWKRIRKDRILWNQVCTSFMKQRFTNPVDLDDLNILWPSTSLPEDAHENIAFLMGLNFVSRVLDRAIEVFQPLNEYVLNDKKLTRDQVFKHMTKSLPPIVHIEIESDDDSISYAFTLNQQITLNTHLYERGKTASNSESMVRYAFLMGVTIIHQMAHFKMRVHQEDPKTVQITTSPEKFMRESREYVEINLFGGVWEHRPTLKNFSELLEMILKVQSSGTQRYYCIPQEIIHQVFCESFWGEETDTYESLARFKKMFIKKDYNVTKCINKEKKKAIETVSNGPRRFGHDEKNPNIVY